MKKFVDVVIFKNVLSLDRLYTYVADFHVEVGDFVLVDFNGDLNIALVLADNKEELTQELKPILKILPEMGRMSGLHMKLGLWMKQFYILTYGKAFGILSDFSRIYDLKYKSDEFGVKIPSYRISTPEGEEYFKLNSDKEAAIGEIKSNASRQLALLDELYSLERIQISLRDIKTLPSYSKKTLDGLISKGIVEITEEVQREPIKNKTILNEKQKEIFDDIKESNENKFLIKGVTGSGKTEIYFALIEDALSRGKSSFLLVPEIGLTPQMVDRAKARFGSAVSLIHSKLSKKDRAKELSDIDSKVPRLVLGTRSAIFSRIDDFEYIIMDEEHDDSYKLDSNNKYDVREVARFMVENTMDSKLVLGSATPSIETYYKAKNDVYKLYNLEERANLLPLPKVKIVDMREELRHGNTTIFSMDLMAGMKSALNRNEQIMLFLNRRGYSPAVSCRDCGHTIMCDACDIAMVYHKNTNTLKCHYCGKVKHYTRRCPNCGSSKIKQFGIGTEKLEESTRTQFSDFNIIRIDSDTTSRKSSYESNYQRIINKEVSIIIGTQMITKGFDFPEITLVGVVAADLSLNIPEYDASEKTFQLLTQVAGRSGRSDKPGEVIVQTYNPEHFSIKYAKEHDYEGFYNTELSMRRAFSYPPFKRLFTINLLSSDHKKLTDIYVEVHGKIQRGFLDLDIDKDADITSDAHNPIVSRVNNRYKTKIILSAGIKNEKLIKNLIYELLITNKSKIDLSGIGLDLIIR